MPCFQKTLLVQAIRTACGLKRSPFSLPLAVWASLAAVNTDAADHAITAVDGFTTVHDRGNNTHQVINTYQTNSTPVNVFNDFVVGAGHTVNLEVPDGADTLVNIVRSSRPEVHGTLNSFLGDYNNGTLGGNIVFASSRGFLVGATGIVNVGQLQLKTPTDDTISHLVDTDNTVINSSALSELLNNQFSISSSGTVTLEGKITTAAGIDIRANQVVVADGATVMAGDNLQGNYVNVAAVSTGDYSAPTGLREDNGVIVIEAAGKGLNGATGVEIAGDLLADGGITISAADIDVSSTGLLDTRDSDSSRIDGDIQFSAQAQASVIQGDAIASTGITLGGTLYANTITASAHSETRASFFDSTEGWVAYGVFNAGAFLSGLNANYVSADSAAEVTVTGDAILQADSTITLSSEALSHADDPAVALNGTSLLAAAVVYGEANADSRTEILTGAQVSAGDTLELSAHNEAYLSMSALTLTASSSEAVTAVAIGAADVDAQSRIESGAEIDADNLIITADNHNSFYVGAAAYGLSDETDVGAAVAIGDFNTQAITELGADVGTASDKVGNVDVVAVDFTESQRVHSGVMVGLTALVQTLVGGAVSAVGAVQNTLSFGISETVGAKLAGIQFQAGMALTYLGADSGAYAYLGNTVDHESAPVIHSDGNIAVISEVDTRALRTSAEASVNSPEKSTGTSVAINLAEVNKHSVAEVGEGVSIDAQRVGIGAWEHTPIVSTYDQWDTFSEVISKLNLAAGLQNNLLTSYASAAGESRENNLQGTFNYQVMDHKAKAWVGDNATITVQASSDDAWISEYRVLGIDENFHGQDYHWNWDSSLSVLAYNQLESVHIAGNLFFFVLPATASYESGTSLGGSVSYVDFDTKTLAGLGANVNLTALNDTVVIDALTEEMHVLVSPTSGQYKGFGFNGIAGYLSSNNITHASIHHAAAVTADEVLLTAEQRANNWSAAGSAVISDTQAIGVAVAVNHSKADTRAYIGDNQDTDALVNGLEGLPGTANNDNIPVVTAGITTRDLRVRANSSGHLGALAVAGTLNQDSEEEPSAPYGLTVSGSGSSVWSDADTRADIDQAVITGFDDESVAVTLQALSRVDQISAAGSAALDYTQVQQVDLSGTVAGAVAYQVSENNVEASVTDSDLQQAGMTHIQALNGGDRIGLGLAIPAAASYEAGSVNIAVSASIASVKDSAAAYVADSAVTADNANSDLEISAYNITDIGIGGGSFYLGGEVGGGIAVTYVEIHDPNQSVDESESDTRSALIYDSYLGEYEGDDEANEIDDGVEVTAADQESFYTGEDDDVDSTTEVSRRKTKAVEALVFNSTLSGFDDIDVVARQASRVVAGAASGGYSSVDGALGFVGSQVLTDIGATTQALIEGSVINNTDTLDVIALGDADASLNTVLEQLGANNDESKYDFSGEATIEQNADGKEGFEASGSRIIAVAGVLQGGTGENSNIGLSYVHNHVNTTHNAHIIDTDITVDELAVTAENEAYIISMAVGLGQSTGPLAGVGSVSINEIDNRVIAEIGDRDASSRNGAIVADKVDVIADNGLQIYNTAGAIAISFETAGSAYQGGAAGFSSAVNLVGNNAGHDTIARIAHTDLAATEVLRVSATSGEADTDNFILNNAIGVAVVANQGYSIAGAVSINQVEQSLEAQVKNIGTDQTVATVADSVLIEAHDYTDAMSTASVVAGTTQGSSSGIGYAHNRIDTDVTAELLGDDSDDDSVLPITDLTIDASRDSRLLTLGVGITVANDTGLAPSISTGIAKGTVTARIAEQANVAASNNVWVHAQSHTLNRVGAGSVGIGVNNGAGAGAVATALESGNTLASISDATVNAKAQGNAININSGVLADDMALADLADEGEGENDGSSRATRDALTTDFDNQALDEDTEQAKGIVVSASSHSKQRAITAAGSGSQALAVSANVATTQNEGSTRALVDNAKLNPDLSDAELANTDVTVRASSHELALGMAAGVAGSGDTAGVAGIVTHLQEKDVNSQVTHSQIKADHVALNAYGTRTSQAVAAGMGVGSNNGGAASVVTTHQHGNTLAWLRGGTVNSNSLAVTAESRQKSNMASGSVGLGGTVGLGIGLAINLLDGDTQAIVGIHPDDLNDTTSTDVHSDTINIDATRDVTAESYAFGAGLSANTGGAGMINVSEITGETRAGVYGTYDNGAFSTQLVGHDGLAAAEHISVDAQERLALEQQAFGLGVGANVGLGLVSNTLLGRSQNYAESVGSRIMSDDFSLHANSEYDADLYSLSGAGGQVAGALSLGIVLFGQGQATAGDGTNADTEFSSSRDSVDAVLTEDYAANNPHLTSSDADNVNGLNNQEYGAIEGVQADTEAAYTDSGHALKLADESITAARISGGDIDVATLTVDSALALHTDVMVGAAQVSAVGASGGLGMTRLYGMNYAVVDADITAETLTIDAETKNLSDDRLAAEMDHLIIGAAGVGAGIAYGDIFASHRVVAGLARAQTANPNHDQDQLIITAKDSTELRIGDTHDSMNLLLGAGALGASVAIAEKDAQVDAWLGGYDTNNTDNDSSDDTVTLVDGYNQVDVIAEVSGAVRTAAFAANGGLIYGAQGVLTDARDTSSAHVNVGGRIAAGDGVVRISALTVPETISYAYGVSVSIGGSAGGSFAYATADTVSQATLAHLAAFTEGADVEINAITGDADNPDYRSADAQAFASAGSLSISATATEARAENQSQTVVTIGDYIALPHGHLVVNADHVSRQLAQAEGYFVGAVSAGYNKARVDSQTSTRISWGKDPIGLSTRDGDLSLNAYSVDENQAFATAGGGGAISGSAALAVVNVDDRSDNQKAVSVDIADWSVGYSQSPVGAGNISIAAEHQVNYLAATDSIHASLLGGSGSQAEADIDNTVQVMLGKNMSFEGYAIDIDVLNSVQHMRDPWLNGFESNAFAGAGGVVNGSASLSRHNLDLTAQVLLGEGIHLSITPLAWFDTNPTHDIEIDAATHFLVDDEAKLEVGGALQGAGSESDVDVTTQNTVRVGNNSTFSNPVGGIGIGTYSRGTATAEANTSVWAVAGVAGGHADVKLDVNNNLDLGDNYFLSAYDTVGLYAGRASNYLDENQLAATAHTNVYNGTAVPIPAGNHAESDIYIDNSVIMGRDATIAGDNHVYIEANEGQVYAHHTGVERNPYLEIFSTETTFGSSKTHAASDIVFQGSAHVVAGQYAYQSVDIDENGLITDTTAETLDRADSVTLLDEQYSSRDNLQAYIDELQARVDELEAWDDTETIEEGGTLDDPGVDDNTDTDLPGSGTGGGDTSTASSGSNNPHQQEINELKAEIADLTVILNDLSDVPNDVVRIANFSASAGNVYLLADNIERLGNEQEQPLITAKGDASITINNRSDNHIMLDSLGIANRTGGNVFVNGGASLDEQFIQELSGTEPGIHIDHNPTGTQALQADVIIEGDLTNLASSISLDLGLGDLIQQARIEARSITIDVVEGGLLLNNPDLEQAYGRSPNALVHFTDQWKPSSAQDVAHYWINAAYEDEFNDLGVDAFNAWFSGTAIKHQDQKVDGYNYDTLNVYFNWGFSNSEETPNCDNASDCNRFGQFGNKGSSSRGGAYWRFDSIQDKQNELLHTASYADVNHELGEPGATIIGQTVVINAKRVDINGRIEAGRDNAWSVTIGAGFDAAMAEYIEREGLSTGDTVRLTPGQIWQYADNTIDPEISKNDNTSDIPLIYSVADNTLMVDDVPVSGGGYVSIRARISSTGEKGEIRVKDGLGHIHIDNQSDTELVLGTLNAGEDATGIIKLTDLNKSSDVSQWYVHNPGEQIQQYQTDAWAVSYDGQGSQWIGAYGDEGSSVSTSYTPEQGQLYYIREGATVGRSYTAPADGYLAQYPNTVGDWQYTTAWNTEAAYYTTCAAQPEACTDGSATDYVRHAYDADTWDRTSSRFQWNLSYKKYYGSGLVDADPDVRVAKQLWLDTETFIKADHAIDLNFTGQANGVIDIDSHSSMHLTGTLYNPKGLTHLDTDADIIAGSSGASIHTDTVRLSAAGNIGAVSNPVTVFTDTVDINAQAGAVHVRLIANNDHLNIEKLHAQQTLWVNADKTLMPVGDGIHLQGETVFIRSENGGLGAIDSAQALHLASAGTVSLHATKDINIHQPNGDLRLNTLTAGDDVALVLGNGSLINGSDQGAYTSEESAYQAGIWDSLHLLSDEAATMTVVAYENKVSTHYHNLWSIKQRLDDDSDSHFAINAAYLPTFKRRYQERQAALGNELNIDDISDATVTESVKEEYQSQKSWLDDEFGVGHWPFGLTHDDTYDAQYQYTLDLDSTRYAELTDGAQWSESQLEVRIAAAAIETIDQVTISSRAANISGQQVNINTTVGGVGKDNADLVFTVDRDNPDLTDVQKSALLNAGPGDITSMSANAQIEFTVKQQMPIKINAEQILAIEADSNVYLESDGHFLIDHITTARDVRLAASEAITGFGDQIHIRAHDLNLINAAGDIGTLDQALTISTTGVLRQAYAADNMYLENRSGSLTLGVAGAGNEFHLNNTGAIHNWSANGESVHIRAASAFLTAYDGNERYNLGSADRRLRMALHDSSELHVLADGAWLFIDDTLAWTVADADLAGALDISTHGDATLGGAITAHTIHLDSTRSILDSTPLSYNIDGALQLTASHIDIDAITVTAAEAYLESRAGKLILGDLTTTSNNITLLAADEIALQGEIHAATELFATANTIHMQETASLTATDDLQLSATDHMNLTALQAENLTIHAINTQTDTDRGCIYFNGPVIVSNDVSLNASHTITSNNTLNAVGDITLNAASFTMNANSHWHTDGDLSLTTSGDQILDQLSVSGNMEIDAAAVRFNDSVSSHNMTLTVDGVAALSREQDIRIEDELKAKADTWTMASGSRLIAGSDIGIDAQQAIHITHLETTSSGHVSLALETQGAITGDTHSQAHLRASSANAKALLIAGTGIGHPLVIQVPWVYARTNQGDIALVIESPNSTATIQGNGNVFASFTNRNGGLANQVDASVNGTDIVFEHFRTRYGSISSSDHITIETGEIINALAIDTPSLTLAINNDDPSALPVDAQMMTPEGEFYLNLAETTLTTDALVTRYNPPLILNYIDKQANNTQEQNELLYYFRLSAEYLMTHALNEGNKQIQSQLTVNGFQSWFDTLFTFEDQTSMAHVNSDEPANSNSEDEIDFDITAEESDSI